MKSGNVCVHVKSQEEWDRVIKSLRSDYYNSFTSYSQVCIDLKGGCYCSWDWFLKHGYKIISFSDWLYSGPTSSEWESAKSSFDTIKNIIINVPKI